MARDLPAALTTEMTATALTPVLLVEAAFDSGTLHLWSGYGDLDWNGETYTGTGTLMAVSPVQESADIRANGMTFTLSGLPSAILSLALNEPYQGRTVKVYLGALDTDGVMVSDPYLLFEGRMDVMSVEESGEEAAVQVSVENALIDLERPRLRRYTDEDQQLEYPGDAGFAFVAALQDKEVVWGR